MDTPRGVGRYLGEGRRIPKRGHLVTLPTDREYPTRGMSIPQGRSKRGPLGFASHPPRCTNPPRRVEPAARGLNATGAAVGGGGGARGLYRAFSASPPAPPARG